MNDREVLAARRANGRFEANRVGSHLPMRHAVKPGRGTLPHPKRDIPIGTLRSIGKQAGIELQARP